MEPADVGESSVSTSAGSFLDGQTLDLGDASHYARNTAATVPSDAVELAAHTVEGADMSLTDEPAHGLLDKGIVTGSRGTWTGDEPESRGEEELSAFDVFNGLNESSVLNKGNWTVSETLPSVFHEQDNMPHNGCIPAESHGECAATLEEAVPTACDEATVVEHLTSSVMEDTSPTGADECETVLKVSLLTADDSNALQDNFLTDVFESPRKVDGELMQTATDGPMSLACSGKQVLPLSEDQTLTVGDGLVQPMVAESMPGTVSGKLRVPTIFADELEVSACDILAPSVGHELVAACSVMSPADAGKLPSDVATELAPAVSIEVVPNIFVELAPMVTSEGLPSGTHKCMPSPVDTAATACDKLLFLFPEEGPQSKEIGPDMVGHGSMWTPIDELPAQLSEQWPEESGRSIVQTIANESLRSGNDFEDITAESLSITVVEDLLPAAVKEEVLATPCDEFPATAGGNLVATFGCEPAAFSGEQTATTDGKALPTVVQELQPTYSEESEAADAEQLTLKDAEQLSMTHAELLPSTEAEDLQPCVAKELQPRAAEESRPCIIEVSPPSDVEILLPTVSEQPSLSLAVVAAPPTTEELLPPYAEVLPPPPPSPAWQLPPNGHFEQTSTTLDANSVGCPNLSSSGNAELEKTIAEKLYSETGNAALTALTGTHQLKPKTVENLPVAIATCLLKDESTQCVAASVHKNGSPADATTSDFDATLSAVVSSPAASESRLIKADGGCSPETVPSVLLSMTIGPTATVSLPILAKKHADDSRSCLPVSSEKYGGSTEVVGRIVEPTVHQQAPEEAKAGKDEAAIRGQTSEQSSWNAKVRFGAQPFSRAAASSATTSFKRISFAPGSSSVVTSTAGKAEGAVISGHESAHSLQHGSHLLDNTPWAPQEVPSHETGCSFKAEPQPNAALGLALSAASGGSGPTRAVGLGSVMGLRGPVLDRVVIRPTSYHSERVISHAASGSCSSDEADASAASPDKAPTAKTASSNLLGLEKERLAIISSMKVRKKTISSWQSAADSTDYSQHPSVTEGRRSSIGLLHGFQESEHHRSSVDESCNGRSQGNSLATDGHAAAVVGGCKLTIDSPPLSAAVNRRASSDENAVVTGISIAQTTVSGTSEGMAGKYSRPSVGVTHGSIRRPQTGPWMTPQ